ncbi:MAG: nucleotide sugar dehydrogenase, partial [Sphingomicrobium sp.]
NNPDLRAVISATNTVAEMLTQDRCATVIYESTVYPGVTEDICGALLEERGFVPGEDFKLGYSPERINPGDRVHTVDKITKVIAAEDTESLDLLEQIYGSITSGGVYRASSIKVAEASKAIENAQRDINIAFVNEIAKLSANVGISVWDVLDASRTKWNFLPFEPGLVGGHCIGVDPYYLSHLSEKVGLHPQVILAGRDTNDGMGAWIADQLHAHRNGQAGRALILGVTFKENVPDIRNSKVIDVASRLEELGHEVHFADAHADADEVREAMGCELVELNGDRFDLVIGAVPHDEYRALDTDALRRLLKDDGTVADLKAQWRDSRAELGRAYWTL